MLVWVGPLHTNTIAPEVNIVSYCICRMRGLGTYEKHVADGCMAAVEILGILCGISTRQSTGVKVSNLDVLAFEPLSLTDQR